MFYEKIKKILAHKDHCMVKRNDGDYCVFSSIKDQAGDYRISGWNGKENVKISITSEYGFSEEKINRLAKEQNWQIVEMWDNYKKRFQPEDKVRIADNAKELCREVRIDWNEIKQEMVGKVFQAEIVYTTGYFIKGWYFPHSALEPVFDDDNL